jgi:hypothetical protein
MRCLLFLLIFAAIVIPGCEEKSSDPLPIHIISGTVYYNDNPAQSASVSVDDFANWRVETDSDGYFEIADVSEGVHSLKSTLIMEDGSFSERSQEIMVLGDVEIDSLTLPEAIELYPPDSITDNSISLRWSPSDANDFREYKLFRGNSSGLDENTGELVHIATARYDTSFINEDLASLTTYFYRVYVMNDFGRLGGSNIVSATTENFEVILNGDFEIIDQINNFPENWSGWNNVDFIVLDSLEVHSGNYSVGVFMTNTDPGHHTLHQLINPDRLTENERYRITYWAKVDTLDDQGGFYAFIRDDNWNWHLMINPVLGPAPGFDWSEFDYEFTVPDGISTSNFMFGFSFESPSVSLDAWFDNVSIQRVE